MKSITIAYLVACACIITSTTFSMFMRPNISARVSKRFQRKLYTAQKDMELHNTREQNKYLINIIIEQNNAITDLIALSDHIKGNTRDHLTYKIDNLERQIRH